MPAGHHITFRDGANPWRIARGLAAGAAILLLSTPTAGAAADAWHFGAAATARLVRDSNVFLQNRPAPGASVVVDSAPAEAADLLTTLAARFDALGPLRPGLQFDGSYVPEVHRYARLESENHTDHRLNLALAGGAGHWSGEFRSAAVLTDGADTAPVFGQRGGSPAIGGEPVRSRRSQSILRSSARVVRRDSAGFWRFAATVNAQDFHVAERADPGCANYVDRSDWSAGLDRGWTLRRDLALVAGVRAGTMTQADLLGVRLNHSNRFMRPLLGMEGTPVRGVRLTVSAGSDFRRFGPAVAPGFARDRRATFADASVAWTAGPNDTVTFAGRRQLALASGGRGSYVDTLAELSWRHQAGTRWSWTGAARCQAGDNTSLVASSPRHDRIGGGAVTVVRALGKAARLEAGLARDWGRSLLPAMPGRAYDRWTESLAITRSW